MKAAVAATRSRHIGFALAVKCPRLPGDLIRMSGEILLPLRGNEMSDKSNADPEQIPEFDRVMRGLVNVDPAGLNDVDEGKDDKEEAKPCPYCGMLMEAGTILGGKRRLLWAQGNPSWWAIWNGAADEQIGEGGRWGCARIAALRCTKCRRICLRY